MAAQDRWIRGPAADTAVAWCWVPFAVMAHALEPSVGSIRQLLGAVLLFSFLHQPLTLALVYGSPERFRRHRKVFVWSPFVLLAAVAVGTQVSLTLVAAVGGLWNAEHTLMQRFGVTRIYGRKGGDDLGRLEKPMLVSWLVFALVWVAADQRTPGLVARVGLDQVNASALATLHHVGGLARLLLVPAGGVVAALAARWARAERADRARRAEFARNPAKHSYLLATALLFAVILIDPVAGFVAYVGAHAVEYFTVVHSALGRPSGRAGVLERTVARSGRTGFLAAYVGGVIGLLAVLDHWATPLEYTIVVLTLGGLHIFYDGFIWKLRQPSVATTLAVPVTR
jgi:hypothetical protein